MSETNDEGLTWPEWAAAAGCSAVGEGILRREWRDGVDPTEYRANPERRDLLASVIAIKATKAEAEDWLFNERWPRTGYTIVQGDGVWWVVKPRGL
jgi:hypothetical protein